MRAIVGLLSIAIALMIGMALPAAAKPLETMADVGAAIMACWVPPSGSRDSSVTLQFSFKRDGTLFGDPRPTRIAVKGDADAQRAFVRAAIDAVRKCTPLTLSDALAAGMGGNVFTLDFRAAAGGENAVAAPSPK